jgi:translation initiation factor IF-3
MAHYARRGRYDRTPPKNRTRINEDIDADRVRVVSPDGNHGIFSVDEALEKARRFNLDLVEISPNADPPVCKIIDYGKYRYEQQKKEKEQRKNSATVQMKSVRFRPQTDDHDFDFKTKHARRFLSEGNKVKAWVEFRGRAILYQDQGMDLLRRFIIELEDDAQVDQPPRMEGRRMTTILAPSKGAKKK